MIQIHNELTYGIDLDKAVSDTIYNLLEDRKSETYDGIIINPNTLSKKLFEKNPQTKVIDTDEYDTINSIRRYIARKIGEIRTPLTIPELIEETDNAIDIMWDTTRETQYNKRQYREFKDDMLCELSPQIATEYKNYLIEREIPDASEERIEHTSISHLM